MVVRKSAVYMDSKNLGKIWLGLQETAKDNIVKDTIVIKGLDQTMYADFYMNWSFFLRPVGAPKNSQGLSTIRFRDIGRCYSTSSSAFDCSTRRNEVRYDTPEWEGWLKGLVFSWAWGEDDIWSGSVRYRRDWENWSVGMGYAYEDFTDEGFNDGGGGVPFQSNRRHMKEWAGMFSVLHHPTGLFVWGANSNSENDDFNARGWLTDRAPPVMHAYDIAAGIHKDWFAPGKTTIWGGYTRDQDGIGGFTRSGGDPQPFDLGW